MVYLVIAHLRQSTSSTTPPTSESVPMPRCLPGGGTEYYFSGLHTYHGLRLRLRFVGGILIRELKYPTHSRRGKAQKYSLIEPPLFSNTIVAINTYSSPPTGSKFISGSCVLASVLHTGLGTTGST